MQKYYSDSEQDEKISSIWKQAGKKLSLNFIQAMTCCQRGDEPLPEPMLTKIYDAMIWLHWATMGSVIKKFSNIKLC